jgi:hypothetical protein
MSIDNRSRAAQGRARRADRDAKSHHISTHGNAEIAIVAAAEDVTVDERVCSDPAVVSAARCRAGVFARRRLQPELNREIGGAEVSRARRCVDRDAHAIQPSRIYAATVQAQGVVRALSIHCSIGCVSPVAPGQGGQCHEHGDAKRSEKATATMLSAVLG